MNGIGKVKRSFLEKIVLSNLGAQRTDVISKPRSGVDTGAIVIDRNKIMVFSADPLSIIPSLELKDSGWLSAHLLLNDIVTSGFKPCYASLVFNLPPKIKDEEFRIYLESLTNEFKKLEVSVVSGHTGRYFGCDYSIIGAGTVMAIGQFDNYIDSSKARKGDSIIITKGIGLEATSILSKSFPNFISKNIGELYTLKAKKSFFQCSSVKDAFLASSIGLGKDGVTSMHDATEGGLFGGLIEIAIASSNGVRVEIESIPISNEVKQICTLFDINPYSTLSAGTLIITVNPNKEEKLIDILKKNGIKASIIGKITSWNEGINYFKNGIKNPISIPEEDPYWKSFWKLMHKRVN